MYTNEKHALMVLSLLKAHGVRKIVVSPGSTNIPISGSVQQDSFFEVYSSVDERSAAYMACGLAEASGEMVALSCTGATASRNYLSGLTEAFYRKLPVIAITSFNGNEYNGHLVAQNIDRKSIQNDVAKLSVHIPVIKDQKDEWYCNTLVNQALLEARRGGGGPVHINMSSSYTGVFDVKELPKVRVISRHFSTNNLPDTKGRKVAIFVGAHKTFSEEDITAIEMFCEKRICVVICDHTSNYSGRFKINGALLASNYGRLNVLWKELCPDLVIHLGEVSGDYPSSRVLSETREVWRVSEDGELRDQGKKLSLIYQGTEQSFFEGVGVGDENNSYYELWLKSDKELRSMIPELPFSNLWMGSKLSEKLNFDCSLHLGILNSLRSWNYFDVPKGVSINCNVGGFGIDGCMSTMIGSSLVDKEKLHFIVLGDLAFFYDLNSLANRHLGKNVRILLVNNGCGVEFNNSSHIASRFGVDANQFIAAGGHFNSGSNGSSEILGVDDRVQGSLAKAWCEKLGFRYRSVRGKTDFSENLDMFLDSSSPVPIIMECFTEVRFESSALECINNLNKSAIEKVAGRAKKVLPSGVSSKAKKILLGK